MGGTFIEKPEKCNQNFIQIKNKVINYWKMLNN